MDITTASSTGPGNAGSISKKTSIDCGIPIIDLSPHRDETEIVSEVLDAFTTIGFCTLINHGISPDLFRKAFDASRNFFELPIEIKLKYKYKTPSSNRGYIPYGAEKHDKDKEGRLLVTGDAKKDTLSNDFPASDQKETMDIGYDGPDKNGGNSGEEKVLKNEWPEELSSRDFREVLETYFEEMDTLHLRLMKYVGKGLALPDDGGYLVQKCNEKHENLRLLHYPSINIAHTAGAGTDGSPTPMVRGNAHTDFGTLTLLVQDKVGGLKVKRTDGIWIDVQPVKDSIIVNVGDMLMRWSNNRLKATLHKVESPSNVTTTTEKNAIVPERYSIAFFCNANKNVEIKNFFENEITRYPPINAHEYLTQRLAATIQT